MESDRDPRQLLAEAERASAAPYIDYPPTPGWYAPAVGAWAAAMVLTIGAMGDNKLVAVPVLIVLIALEGAFFAWYRHYRKVNPTLTNAPPEIAGAMRRYAVGVVVVVAACILAFVLGGAIVSAVVAFVTVTVGLLLYERRYAAAAAATRQRLS
ncbi:MAG: hypothetical protein ABW219_00750 [Ilumatobacteraceae bacterium]